MHDCSMTLRRGQAQVPTSATSFGEARLYRFTPAFVRRRMPATGTHLCRSREISLHKLLNSPCTDQMIDSICSLAHSVGRCFNAALPHCQNHLTGSLAHCLHHALLPRF
eukprot:1580918-Pleurochrysis_carterae.AAC.1